MKQPQIVIDTNVLVSGMRSRNGASYRLLELVGANHFQINLSVPLVFEYEDALYRQLPNLSVTKSAVDAIIDYFCLVGRKHQIYFLWRPLLRDPKDDMILELAVKSECEYIITHNTKDFQGAAAFGLQVVTPGEYLIQQELLL
jgi:putative PIN family toxin of toxin-antitoxin system